MKFVGLLLLLCFAVGGSMNATPVNNANKKDYAAAVAGTYNGEAFTEIMQQKMKLKLELQRTHRDSVIVVVKDFMLPNGQKFSYRSNGVSVKPEVKDGKTVYKLNISFTYTYNGMPMKVTATGTVKDGELDSLVRATIMDAMETKVTYKAKKA